MAYKGIDVSSHNGAITWKKVKDGGIAFAMLRVGLATSADKKFVEYYKGAKSAGIALGGYWFSYALNTTQALQEADACASLLASYPLDLPLFYDFEDDTERYAKEKKIVYTNALRTSIIQAFCSRLKSRGVKVGIYTNENYIVNLTNWNALKSWPLWLAKWSNYGGKHATDFTVSSASVQTKYGAPTFWQFTDSGKVPGIWGNVDLDYYYGLLPEVKIPRPDKYTENGLTFRRCKEFRVVYHDSPKTSANYGNYINAGFFGNFKAANGKIFTLPVANVVCDPWVVPPEGRDIVMKYIKGGKMRWSCADNRSTQFKTKKLSPDGKSFTYVGKKVSTLIVPREGKPYIADVSEPPADCLYAISGVPTVRGGDDVDYEKYVKPQGWDESCMVRAYRNWLGIRDGEIWIISGKTTTNNYIYGMEFWNKVKGQGFDDIICLDGGGSYIYSDNGKVTKTSENRRINSVIVFK